MRAFKNGLRGHFIPSFNINVRIYGLRFIVVVRMCSGVGYRVGDTLHWPFADFFYGCDVRAVVQCSKRVP